MDEAKQLAPQRMPAGAHLYGVAALLTAAVGVPMIWTVSAADKLSAGDRWALRAIASAALLTSAPVAAFYLKRASQ